jgi:hypothetical protein
MSQHQFDAPAELDRIRRYRSVCQRKAYQRSRLQTYRSELAQMRRAGASFRELALWLRGKRIKVTHTTIMRYLAKLPELQTPIAEEEKNHAELS